MQILKVHGTIPVDVKLPIFSWLIRLGEWSDISHVVIELPDERIYHAYFNEVLYENAKDWKKKVNIKHSYSFSIPNENYEAMIEWCDSYKGKKKGYFLKLFGALIPQIFRKIFNKYIKNTFSRTMKDNATCSELIRFLAVRYWNFEVRDMPYAENFTTTDVLEMMKNNAGVG